MSQNTMRNELKISDISLQKESKVSILDHKFQMTPLLDKYLGKISKRMSLEMILTKKLTGSKNSQSMSKSLSLI